LVNLGHPVSDQTVGNILRRYGIPPAPKGSQNTTWKDFITSHMVVLAGTDFFTVEVLTWRGLATYYVLFFIHLESRRRTVQRRADPDTATTDQTLAGDGGANAGSVLQPETRAGTAMRFGLHAHDRTGDHA
jgi:hypothetical protein